ncbi:hypothetical protein DXA26_04310 [Bacteroides fragilis]|jgi:hypothetical protein|nr:hypothetical protein DXA26_04310 [Bacteroides fragilis]
MKNRGSITITGLEDINRQPTVSVKIENGNVWMTKHELAGLFGVFVQTIDANMRSIFKSGILYDGDVTITERQEKDGKVHYVTFYNLEAIIYLSFRINGYCSKLFREWVLNSLCEYKRLKDKQPEVFVVFNSSDNQTFISYN